MKPNKLIILVILAFMAVPIHANATDQSNAHQFGFETAIGERINLADYAGKAVLVVNTASQCSFTEQYGPLQTLHERYRDRGFSVIAVPSNDFGGQEPGGNEEIVEFAKGEFGVDFPITTKTKVIGSKADPFYHWAAAQVGALGKPRWNFHKYLIGPDGKLVTWFSTFTEPDSAKLAKAIEDALPGASAEPES